MFTPQQIDQISFSKSTFGGYNMQQVDEFLEPLTEDYVTLYKENALLKSKMRVLVGKLEEYRKNEAAMKQLMQEQKVRAREARKALGDLGWAGVEFGKEIPATTFIGYTNMEAEGKIVAIVADEELQGAITSGTDAILVLDQTPFYAEMGGQVADHGTIHTETAEFYCCRSSR